MFNPDNKGWKTGKYPLFLGDAPALHDTINVNYPEIQKLALRQVTNRWVFNEFNHEQSRLDLLSCPKNIYQCMLMNLAYQWEADSVAARAIAPLFAPFVSNPELWEALLENCNMEVTHAKTYSHIVRQCVANPAEVFKLVMESQQTQQRASAVNQAFDMLAVAGASKTLEEHENGYADPEKYYSSVMTGMVALYALERIQFMASFAATFAIVEQGYFQSIGKAVQKIMVDEVQCHAALDRKVLETELQTKQGKLWLKSNKPLIKNLLDEVTNSELEWAPHLFSQGRTILGLNTPLLQEWTLYNAEEVYGLFGLKLEGVPKTNPLPWMDNWIDIDKTQNANQEADNNNYALNVVKDDLGDEVLEF